MSHNANLTPGNIKAGVNIGGVVGTYDGKKAIGTHPDSGDGNNASTGTINVGFKPDVVWLTFTHWNNSTRRDVTGTTLASGSPVIVGKSNYNLMDINITMTSNGFDFRSSYSIPMRNISYIAGAFGI